MILNGVSPSADIQGNMTDVYILSKLRPGTGYVCSILAYTVADGPRSIHLTAVTRATGKIINICAETDLGLAGVVCMES